MSRLLIAIGSYVCLYFGAFAQINNYVPDAYNYFSQNVNLYNPSYIPAEGAYTFTLSHKFLTGQFKDISNTNFIAARNIRKNQNAMAFRINVGNEQEGPYISIPKFGFSYGYQLALRRQLSLSLGATLGATGVYFSTPSLSSSFFVPDGTLGVGLTYKKTYVGVAALQIFDGGPASFMLKRYYNTLVLNEVDLNYRWKLKNQFYGIQLSNNSYDLKYALLFSYDRRFDVGMVLRSKSGYSFLATFLLPMKDNRFQLSFVYNTNYVRRKNYYIPNSMELVLGIILD